MRYGRDYDRNFLQRAARSVRGWVGGGRDYDEGYRGRSAPLGRGPETNWNGRNYRDPGEPREYGAPLPRRGYGADFGAGYQPRHGSWEVEWPEAAYDRPYRGAGRMARDDHPRGYDRGFAGGPARGYDRGYARDFAGPYDRGYREAGGMNRGGGADPWGPYSPYRMLQSRSSHWGGDAWPNRYFTDHGHNAGPY